MDFLGPYQFGGFRGTGNNFRETVKMIEQCGLSADCSRFERQSVM